MSLFILGKEKADLDSLLLECFSIKIYSSNLQFLRIIKIKQR